MCVNLLTLLQCREGLQLFKHLPKCFHLFHTLYVKEDKVLIIYTDKFTIVFISDITDQVIVAWCLYDGLSDIFKCENLFSRKIKTTAKAFIS